MGMNARAHLYYGYNFGGYDGWHIEDITEEFGAWHPAWIDADEELDDDCDYIELVNRRLVEVIAGFTEIWTPATDDRYDERQAVARAQVGVELEGYGHYDFRQYVLATYTAQVEWGDIHQLDFADLERQRLAGNWDAALERAVQALGITPTQPRGWLLAASYS